MRSRTVTTKLFFNLSIRLNNYGRGKNQNKKEKIYKKNKLIKKNFLIKNYIKKFINK